MGDRRCRSTMYISKLTKPYTFKLSANQIFFHFISLIFLSGGPTLPAEHDMALHLQGVLVACVAQCAAVFCPSE